MLHYFYVSKKVSRVFGFVHEKHLPDGSQKMVVNKDFLSKGITDKKIYGFKTPIYDLFQNKQDSLLLSILSIYGKIKQ